MYAFANIREVRVRAASVATATYKYFRKVSCRPTYTFRINEAYYLLLPVEGMRALTIAFIDEDVGRGRRRSRNLIRDRGVRYSTGENALKTHKKLEEIILYSSYATSIRLVARIHIRC